MLVPDTVIVVVIAGLMASMITHILMMCFIYKMVRISPDFEVRD